MPGLSDAGYGRYGTDSISAQTKGNMSRRSNRRYSQRDNEHSKRDTQQSGRGNGSRAEFHVKGDSQVNIYKGDRNGQDGWARYKEALLAQMPEKLPVDPAKKNVKVFVEGYEDVSFWRGIFDEYESSALTFEVSVPPREDLAKGKKVLMGMIPETSPNLILCVDSDFDYLFGNSTEQSKTINNTTYLFHTYAYSTESFLCYAPSLHNVCVKATKNDARIFDFEKFLKEYSIIIYPLFIWYAYSAHLKNENVFTLLEFKSSVKLGYVEVEKNGADTLEWLKLQVQKRLRILHRNNPEYAQKLPAFMRQLEQRGLQPEDTYMYMQGHTLMDNVVIIMLNAVCEKLKLMSNIRINTSSKTGVALKNELSNYNNSLRNVRDVLLDNETYKDCPLYKKLQQDIESYIMSLQ